MHRADLSAFRFKAEESLRFRCLVEARLLEPLSTTDEDTRRWVDWDLASLIEGHYHEIVDVRSLSAEHRTSWASRTGYPRARLHNPHTQYSNAYWLLESGERVGTLALDVLPGSQLQRVSSLYVRQDRRRYGIAKRALTAVRDAAVATGLLGLRIDTNWTWQSAVHFYLHLGLWVMSWKDSLAFAWYGGHAPYRLEMAGRNATLLAEREGDWHALLAAENQGEWLGWTELAEYKALRALAGGYHHASGTLALHLAVRGWPLKRSPDLWARRYAWMDAGMPEGLANKITIFERIDREQGYPVQTPRIAGLDYEER